MKKVETIQFKVTSEEKKQFKRLAKKAHLTVSDFIRYKCLIKED